MKKLTYLSFVALGAILFACGTNSASGVQGEVEPFSVDALLVSADTLVGDTVDVKGLCTHTCAHTGLRMFLQGDNAGGSIRIDSGTLGKFDTTCVRQVVKVRGVVVEERIDEQYLQNWEKSVAESQAEEHGDAEEGCSTEKSARGEVANTTEQRIADFRTRISERLEAEGKEYLSFYSVTALSYEKEATAEK